MHVKQEMHRNYFLSSSRQVGRDYLHKYYEGKGLEVIGLYRLPPEVDARAQEVDLAYELGRKTYAVLELIGGKKQIESL